MNLLDLFNHINYLNNTIERNVEKLKLVKNDEQQYNALFIETSRLIDELRFYANQLEDISSSIDIKCFN